MTNPSKDKGTKAEGDVVKAFTARGVPAKREVLHGNSDHGDVHVYGGRVVVEVKWRPKLPSPEQVAAWMVEADREALNAGADLAALVYNRPGRGSTRVGDWCAVMWLDEFLYLATRGTYSTIVANVARTVTIPFDTFAELLRHLPGGAR